MCLEKELIESGWGAKERLLEVKTGGAQKGGEIDPSLGRCDHLSLWKEDPSVLPGGV